MQNFNSAELRPVEFARAYLQKKMLKKPLREDAGADVLRDSPCSAHVSRKLCISPARITHRCLSLPPLIGAREHVLECVLEREFEKSLFSLPLICMQNSTGTYPRARDPHRRPCSRSGIRSGCTRRPPCARRDYFSTVTSSRLHRGKIVPTRARARKGTCEARAGGAARGGAPRLRRPEIMHIECSCACARAHARIYARAAAHTGFLL